MQNRHALQSQPATLVLHTFQTGLVIGWAAHIEQKWHNVKLLELVN